MPPLVTPPRVTLCVPVYNGGAFMAETLDAVARQTYPHLVVAVSDDRSTDESADICQAYAHDPRFQITRQPVRLGWVEHCNWLLGRVATEFVCVVSHDDLPAPTFIARLVSALDARPDAALAFCDVQVFGLLDKTEHQPSIEAADAVERARMFMATHTDGTAFHAVIRRRALAPAGLLRSNAMDHFAADVSWLGRLTRAGAFLRVAEPLYAKRRHAASASLQWGRWSPDQLAAAWVVHCHEVLHDALTVATDADSRERIIRAAVRRVLAIEPTLPFAFIRDLPADRHEAMVEAMLGPGAGMRRSDQVS